MKARIFLAFLVAVAIQPARADDAYFDSHGVKIHYMVEGSGEPVVLIHGLGGSLDRWRSLTPSLTGHYRVIALDCRVHGKSGKPYEPKQYGQEMAEDVIRLLDHLKIRRAHVMGYSMGGMITGNLLATHPDRLITATMGGAAAMRSTDDAVRIAPEAADAMDRGEGPVPIIRMLMPPGQPMPPPAIIKQISQMLIANNDAKAIAALLRGLPGLAVGENSLENNHVPALAIIGSDDPLIKMVQPWQGKMTLFQMVVVKGGNHGTTSNTPEFAQAFRAFLDSHAGHIESHRDRRSERLFDGRSLAGWEAGTAALWRIQDGALVGGSLNTEVPHNDFLATKREYGDFELSLKAKLNGTGFVNGGIQLRSKRISDPSYEMTGYQADMGEGYWGALYDESRRNRILAQPSAAQLKRVLKPDDWNDYRIRCEGPRIRLWLNGELTVDYAETDPSIPLSGLIAVQIHGGGKSEASYRDIVLKEL